MELGDKKPVKPGVDDVRRTTLEKKEDSPHKPTTSQPKPISAPPKLYSGLFFYPNDPYLHLTDSPRDIKEDEGSTSNKTGTGSVSKGGLPMNNIENAAATIVITSTEVTEKETKLIKIPESKAENNIAGEGVDDVNNDQTIKKSINKLLSFEEQKNSPVSHSPALQDMMNSNSPHHQSHQNHFDPNNVGNGQIPPGTQNSPGHLHGAPPVFQSYNTVFVPYIMTPPIPDYYPEMYHSTSPYVPYKGPGAKSHPGKRFTAKGSKKQLELIPGGSMTQIENQPADDEYLLENAASFLAKDQGGCRRLQRRLENDDEEGTFRRRLFERISSNFDELMVDPFGNYLCQKVIESAEEPEMEGIFSVIGDKILEIAFDCHGTRALQKLIELVKLPSLITMIINQLKGHVIELVQDNNGNHVIQKCLNFFDSPHNQFIYDEIRLNVVEVATHKHGCCVIQRCLDHSSATQLTDLVNVIVQHTLELVQDQYGNYVVQYVLDLPEFFPQKQQISSLLAPHLLDLSKQKFASNVIEKCLRMDLAGFKGALIRLLSDANKIAELLCDDFANYVIQSCLQCSTDEERKKLLAHIKSKCEKIKGDELGNKIYGKLAKSYEVLHYDNASGHKESRGNNAKGGKHGEKYGGGPFGPNSANVSEAKSASQKSGKNRKFEQDARTPPNSEIPPFQLSNSDPMNYNNQGGFPSGGFQMPYSVPMQGYFPQNCVYAPSFMLNNQVINQFYNVPQTYQKWNYQGKQ